MRLSTILPGVLAALAFLTAPLVWATGLEPVIRRLDGSRLTPGEIDAEVERLMTKGRVPDPAQALIQNAWPADGARRPATRFQGRG